MISDIETIIESFGKGEMIILIDDEDRENEGDLVVAADHLSPEHINFMIKEGRGLVCAPISKDIAKKISLQLMDGVTNETHTQYTASIDLKSVEVTTGISANDRFLTIKKLTEPSSSREDFNVPGHVFPLQAMEGGVLRRAGHTEGAIDLCKENNLNSVAVVCEIINDEGKMARFDELVEFSKKHNVKIGTIKDLIEYRLKNTELVKKIAESKLPTEYGEFTAHVYLSLVDNNEHIALTMGKIDPSNETMVRVHSECLTGDVLLSTKCDCGSQLSLAMKTISDNKNGILLYIKGHEGRGIGLGNKIKAYSLQDNGEDTVEANIKLGFPPDLRDYGTGAQILRQLNVTKMNLLTNNPSKRAGLEGFGLEITKRTPLVGKKTKDNQAYIVTKKTKMGHLFEESDD
jgi:3,4-dihydroxy 2-butanone 4-phosphate synthase/GTP cyclohydrolase II|tara:strand:- start:1065 stop:2273 length:1209 start_codon:yes stop_codon:yes gene_type:complete